MVGQQWWPSHCPSPISGFQLNSSLWLHNQQEALSAASPHPVSCCLSLLPCHSNGCEHLPHCLSREASPADLDQEQPCLTLFSPAVVQKVLVFSISIYFSHGSLHGTVRYMRISLCLFRPQYNIQPQSCLDCSLAPRSTVIPFPLQTGLMLFPELIGVSSYCHLCKCHEHIVMAPSVPSLGECCFTPEQDVCHGAPIPTKIAQWVFSPACSSLLGYWVCTTLTTAQPILTDGHPPELVSARGFFPLGTFSKPLYIMLSPEGSVGFLLSDWFKVYITRYFNTASRCRSVTIHLGTRRDIF